MSEARYEPCYTCRRPGRVGNHSAVIRPMEIGQPGILFSQGGICRVCAERLLDALSKELIHIKSDAEFDAALAVRRPLVESELTL